MADIASLRGLRQGRSSLTVSEFVAGLRGPVGSPDGHAACDGHGEISVGSILRREGRAPHALDRPIRPRNSRLGAVRVPESYAVRKVAIAAGALVVVGAAVGAAVLIGDAMIAGQNQATGSDDSGTQPNGGVLDGHAPGAATGAAGAQSGLSAKTWASIAFPTPAALVSGYVVPVPVSGAAAAAVPHTTAPAAGPVGGAIGGTVGAVGGTVGGTVGTVGGTVGTVGGTVGTVGGTVGTVGGTVGTVGGTVGTVGDTAGKALPPAVGKPVSTLGTTVGSTVQAVGSTVQQLGTSVLPGNGAGTSTPPPVVAPVGSALSTLTAPLVGTVNSVPGGRTLTSLLPH